MGYSLACSSSVWHCHLIGIFPQRSSRKFVSVRGIQKLTLKFNVLGFHRTAQGLRPFCCKPEEIEFEERKSPDELHRVQCLVVSIKEMKLQSNMDSFRKVKKEIMQCYELIRRLGRGVVYLGSARLGSGHPHYDQAFELGKKIAGLLNCTSWSGAGPGLMDAATKGALEAGMPVGGFKISKEAGEWKATKFHPYLPSDSYLTCRFFSARKHGLVDAAVRATDSDRTAVVVLPGGVGTLDEAFEILALIQLQRIGSILPVPFLLMNYDSFYSKLLEFIDDCERWGTVSNGEVASLWKVCNTNSEALSYLTEYYGISVTDGRENISSV